MTLYKGESILHAITIDMESNHLENFTFHVMAECMEGEEVKMILVIDNTNSPWEPSITLSSQNYPLSTFSGHILRDGL